MRRLTVVVALTVGVALAANAFAREKKQREKATRAGGSFIAATVEGGMVQWKLALDEEGEKTFEMPAQVAVSYTEKNNQKQVRLIRRAGKKPAEAKGDRLVAQGQFVKAEPQGKRVIVTVKLGEGAEAKDEQFALSHRVGVMYRDGGDGKLVAVGITPGRRAKPRKDEGQKGERKKGERKKGDEKPPENL